MQSFGDTVFTPYRQRVLYPIAIVGSVVFLPLSWYHFFLGDPRLGAMLACIVTVLIVDAFAMRIGRRPPIPFPLLLVPGGVAVAFSLLTQGLYGVLWAYPMALFAFFALPRRYANFTALSFGGMVATLVDFQMGAGMALRFLLSLGLCLVVLNLVLAVMESQQRRLHELSITDPLTGAFNRRHMQTSLAAAIERHARTGANASLLLIDIDHFKAITDRLGHEAGDRVLTAVVERVRGRCRQLDTIFRMGGEEFVLLLPDTESLEATGLGEELRRAIASARVLEDRHVTASIGVSQLHPGDTVDGWLRRAAQALYEAKRSGRDCVNSTNTRLLSRLPVVPSLQRSPLA